MPLQSIGDRLPLGYAFAVGMAAAVNPCGFALAAVQLWMYRATSVVSLAPRPATSLQDIQNFSDFQTRFAQNAGKPRLVVLISPT